MLMFRRRDFTYKPPRAGLRVRFSIHASGWQVFQQDVVARSKDRPPRVSVTNYCLPSARHSPLEIPRSFGAHVSLESVLSIWHFAFLYFLSVSFHVSYKYLYINIFFFRENNYSKSEIKNTKF